MRTIWKFPLQMRGWNAIELPAEAKIVLAAIDPASGAPAIWAELDTDAPRIARRFGVFPTGGRIAEEADHVGSMIDRTFVWHIFEARA
jgi:hypothetical protein